MTHQVVVNTKKFNEFLHHFINSRRPTADIGGDVGDSSYDNVEGLVYLGNYHIEKDVEDGKADYYLSIENEFFTTMTGGSLESFEMKLALWAYVSSGLSKNDEEWKEEYNSLWLH